MRQLAARDDNVVYLVQVIVQHVRRVEGFPYVAVSLKLGKNLTKRCSVRFFVHSIKAPYGYSEQDREGGLHPYCSNPRVERLIGGDKSSFCKGIWYQCMVELFFSFHPDLTEGQVQHLMDIFNRDKRRQPEVSDSKGTPESRAQGTSALLGGSDFVGNTTTASKSYFKVIVVFLDLVKSGYIFPVGRLLERWSNGQCQLLVTNTIDLLKAPNHVNCLVVELHLAGLQAIHIAKRLVQIKHKIYVLIQNHVCQER